MGTLNTEAFHIMFYGITEIFYWGFIVTGWWLAIIKFTQIMEAVNQNILTKREAGDFRRVIKAPIVFIINITMIIIYAIGSVGRVFGSKADEIIMKKWGEMVKFDTDEIGEREQAMVERGVVGGDNAGKNTVGRNIVGGKPVVKYESENLKRRAGRHTLMSGGILETLVHCEKGGGQAGEHGNRVDKDGGHSAEEDGSISGNFAGGSVADDWARGITDGVTEENGLSGSVIDGWAGGDIDGVTKEDSCLSVDGDGGEDEENGAGADDGED